MFIIGQTVKVLPPFDEPFSGEYTVTDVVNNPDGSVVYILSDDAGGFDAIYLGAV
jgi:hypothetical protein